MQLIVLILILSNCSPTVTIFMVKNQNLHASFHISYWDKLQIYCWRQTRINLTNNFPNPSLYYMTEMKTKVSRKSVIMYSEILVKYATIQMLARHVKMWKHARQMAKRMKNSRSRTEQFFTCKIAIYEKTSNWCPTAHPKIWQTCFVYGSIHLFCVCFKPLSGVG